jgi:hypothetical protein
MKVRIGGLIIMSRFIKGWKSDRFTESIAFMRKQAMGPILCKVAFSLLSPKIREEASASLW